MENFKFITNITNPCGNGPTLEEYVNKVLQKDAAGIAAPEGEDGEPDTEKGQVISETAEAGKEHPRGESVDGKKCKTKEAAGPAKGEDQKESIEISLPADKEFQKGESEDGSKVTTKTKKTEASSSEWLKISNLNSKQKSMLKQYWLTQYPREYVDAMIEDR